METNTSEEISLRLQKIYGNADNHDKSFGKKEWINLEGVEKALRELQSEVTGKINFKFGRVNDQEFEKGMKLVDRFYVKATKNLEKKLGVKVFNTTSSDRGS